MVKVRYPVWKYYSIVSEENREKAKCIFCNKIFSNIPERMEKHLIYRCTGNPSPTAIQEVSQLYSDRVSNILHKTSAPTPKHPSAHPGSTTLPPPPSPPILPKPLPPLTDPHFPPKISGTQTKPSKQNTKDTERPESYEKGSAQNFLIDPLRINQLTSEERNELDFYMNQFFKKLEDRKSQITVEGRSRLSPGTMTESAKGPRELRRAILQPLKTELASSGHLIGEKALKDLIQIECSLNQLQVAVQHINQVVLKLKQDLQKIMHPQEGLPQHIIPSRVHEPPSTPTDVRPSPIQLNMALGQSPMDESTQLKRSEKERSTPSNLDAPSSTKIASHQHLHLHLNSSSRSPEEHNTPYYT